MTLSENPYFERWIVTNLSRINKGLQGKEALTIGATRIERLSIGVANLHNERLVRDSRLAFTKLWSRISKVP